MIRETIKRITQRLSDIVIQGRNRSMIILGTDRKDSVDSGYGDGGQNEIESATIDIVTCWDPDSNTPNYKEDKSRIYISGKTDPDNYFDINKGESVEGEPAIVNISDNIYLKARKKIKILNDNISILISENGEIEIEAENKATIKVGSANLILNKDGLVSIGTQSSEEDNIAQALKTKREIQSTRDIIQNLVMQVTVNPTSGNGTAVVVPGTIPPAGDIANSKVRVD